MRLLLSYRAGYDLTNMERKYFILSDGSVLKFCLNYLKSLYFFNKETFWSAYEEFIKLEIKIPNIHETIVLSKFDFVLEEDMEELRRRFRIVFIDPEFWEDYFKEGLKSEIV